MTTSSLRAINPSDGQWTVYRKQARANEIAHNTEQLKKQQAEGPIVEYSLEQAPQHTPREETPVKKYPPTDTIEALVDDDPATFAREVAQKASKSGLGQRLWQIASEIGSLLRK